MKQAGLYLARSLALGRIKPTFEVTNNQTSKLTNNQMMESERSTD